MDTEERVYIMINGEALRFQAPKQLLEYLLIEVLGGNIEYSPLSSLRKNIDVIFLFLFEYCQAKKISDRGVFSRKKVFDFCKTREDFISQFYNLLLSLSGCPLLHGFGVSNAFGDKPQGNPERKRITHEKK